MSLWRSLAEPAASLSARLSRRNALAAPTITGFCALHAVQRDLTRGKAEAVQLGGGLVQQAVLAQVARRGRRRQQVPAGAAAGVGGDLASWAT